jgi:6,7-dimethyl-8-ribityllumazine synthase
VTYRLLEPCIDTLVANGVERHDITVAWVPGAFEAPFAGPGLRYFGSAR